MIRQRGFTLLEILVVITLLGVFLLFMGRMIVDVRKTLGTVQTRASTMQALIAAHRFFDQSIEQALPLPLSDAKPLPPCFIGSSGRMQFIAPLPELIGGGLYIHDVYLEQHRIMLGFRSQNGASTVRKIAPVVLLDRVAAASFDYQGLSPQGTLSGWMPQWPWPDHLPQAVRIRAKLDSAPGWTTQVVRLRLQLSSAGTET